jgi:hypothetical protein
MGLTSRHRQDPSTTARDHSTGYNPGQGPRTCTLHTPPSHPRTHRQLWHSPCQHNRTCPDCQTQTHPITRTPRAAPPNSAPTPPHPPHTSYLQPLRPRGTSHTWCAGRPCAAPGNRRGRLRSSWLCGCCCSAGAAARGSRRRRAPPALAACSCCLLCICVSCCLCCCCCLVCRLSRGVLQQRLQHPAWKSAATEGGEFQQQVGVIP